jgi:hypothetical protein
MVARATLEFKIPFVLILSLHRPRKSILGCFALNKFSSWSFSSGPPGRNATQNRGTSVGQHVQQTPDMDRQRQ